MSMPPLQIMVELISEGEQLRKPSEREFQHVYEAVYDMLTKKGYKPQLHKLDNEISRDLMEWIEEQQTEI
eukprot:8227594-Ditylum_brightwellii.AAC.1